MAKNTYYFPHDYNARGDQNLVRLRAKLGWEGVGIYWGIIEKLHENGGVLSKEYGLLAFDLQAGEENIKNIVENFDLFKINNENFENLRVKRNLKSQELKSKKAKISANIGWKNRQANAMRTHSERNAIKEKKGEDIKEINNIYKDFTFFEDEIFKKSYCDYLEMRKKKKRVATETAEKLVLKELHKYSLSEAITMLENSIKSSWTDVYPLKDNKKPLIVIQE